MDEENCLTGPARDAETLAMLSGLMADVVARAGEDPARLWTLVSRELMLGGALVSPECGGLGGGGAELWTILEGLGHARAWTPYLSSVVLAGGVLRRVGADAMLVALAKGEVQPAFAYLEPGRRHACMPLSTRVEEHGDGLRVDGRKILVTALAEADQLIVSALGPDGEPVLLLVPAKAEGVEIIAQKCLDGIVGGEIRLHDVALDAGAILARGAEVREIIEDALDEAVAGLCSAACGTLRELLRRTVDYTRERRQFGQAIADFQVIQHILADMHVATEQAVSLSQVAVAKLRAPAAERREAVSGAKVVVCEALAFVSQSAVQLHGGIGTTEELAIGDLFKRALFFEHGFGGAAHHLARYKEAAASK